MAVVVDLSDQEDKSIGFNIMLDLVRDTWDDADPWGSGIQWLFALGDVYYAVRGECLPEYSPSPMLRGVLDLDHDDWIVQEILSMWDADLATSDDLREMYDFLSELDNQFREMGLDY
jgi:hypothetical protein